MADELIDILNPDNFEIIDTCMKSKAHKEGLLHASAHIWIFNSQGEILIQKRSPDKIAFPNVWDVSVAGHIASGELPTLSAIREVKEEINLDITASHLNYVGTFREVVKHNEKYIDDEVHYIFLVKMNFDFNTLNIQEEEVSEITTIPITVLKDELKNENHYAFAKHPKDYYDFIIHQIEQNLYV